MKLLTSAQWIKEPKYRRYQILDPAGWGEYNYNYRWYNEKIDEKTFQERLAYSAVKDTNSPEVYWTHPWCNIATVDGKRFYKSPLTE